MILNFFIFLNVSTSLQWIHIYFLIIHKACEYWKLIFLSTPPPFQSKKKRNPEKDLDLLLTCLSVSEPNRARLLSFQSYCFCLIILNKITLKSSVCRPLYIVIRLSDFWEIPFMENYIVCVHLLTDTCSCMSYFDDKSVLSVWRTCLWICIDCMH